MCVGTSSMLGPAIASTELSGPMLYVAGGRWCATTRWLSSTCRVSASDRTTAPRGACPSIETPQTARFSRLGGGSPGAYGLLPDQPLHRRTSPSVLRGDRDGPSDRGRRAAHDNPAAYPPRVNHPADRGGARHARLAGPEAKWRQAAISRDSGVTWCPRASSCRTRRLAGGSVGVLGEVVAGEVSVQLAGLQHVHLSRLPHARNRR